MLPEIDKQAKMILAILIGSIAILYFAGFLWPLVRFVLTIAIVCGAIGTIFAGWRLFQISESSPETESDSKGLLIRRVCFLCAGTLFAALLLLLLPRGTQEVSNPNDAEKLVRRNATLAYWQAIQTSDQMVAEGFANVGDNQNPAEAFTAVRTIMSDATKPISQTSVVDVHPKVLDVGIAQIKALNSFVAYCNKAEQHDEEYRGIQDTANSFTFIANCAASGFKGFFTGDPFRPINQLEEQSDALMAKVPELQSERLGALKGLSDITELRIDAKRAVASDLGIDLPENNTSSNLPDE